MDQPLSATPTQRHDASALLAGCHQPWRRQRPDHALLTRTPTGTDCCRWSPRGPASGPTQPCRPCSPSARSLPAVLAWRLWQLLRELPPHSTPLTKSPTPPDPVEDLDDWHQHLAAVHTLGGPAAARVALTTAGRRSGSPARSWVPAANRAPRRPPPKSSPQPTVGAPPAQLTARFQQPTGRPAGPRQSRARSRPLAHRRPSSPPGTPTRPGSRHGPVSGASRGRHDRRRQAYPPIAKKAEATPPAQVTHGVYDIQGF